MLYCLILLYFPYLFTLFINMAVCKWKYDNFSLLPCLKTFLSLLIWL